MACEFAGYVTLLWTSDYRPFAERQVPEVADLNVLPPYRRHDKLGAAVRIDDDATLMLTRLVG